MLQIRQILAVAALVAAPALASAQTGESVHQHMQQGRVIGSGNVVVPQQGRVMVPGNIIVPQQGRVVVPGNVGTIWTNGTVLNGAQQCWQQRDVLGRVQTVCNNNANVNQDLIMRARMQREREAQLRLERERELQIQASREREAEHRFDDRHGRAGNDRRSDDHGRFHADRR